MKMQPGTPPAWVTKVLDAVSDGFQAEIPCGPLGFVWAPPHRLQKRVWNMSVFPTPGEVIEAGPYDGQKAVPGFVLSLNPILAAFEPGALVAWRAPSEFTGELDGPSVTILGRVARRELCLCIFEEPPEAFEPTVFFDRIKKETRLIAEPPEE